MVPIPGNVGAVPRRILCLGLRVPGQPSAPRGRGAGGPRPLPQPGGVWPHLTLRRGLLRVQETATPEVKFLDRCKINRGEGVLQGHVH